MESQFQNLIASVRAGDDTATEELVRRYGAVLRCRVRIWMRMQDARLRRVLDSADICQSVLASFFRRAANGEYDLGSSQQLAALLVRMARNKLAHERSRLLAKKRDVRLAESIGETFAPDPSPSAIARGHELLEDLNARLGEDERRLMELRIEGCDWNEIAAKLGGTPDARRMQLGRAIERATADLGLSRG